MSKHPIVHIEIPASSPQESGKFYAELFGWDIDANNDFDYVMFNPGDSPGGGFTKIDGEKNKVGDVVMYVDTEDIEASLAKAESLGAKTAVGKTEIPGMGWFAMFIDPAGNKIGLYTGNPRD